MTSPGRIGFRAGVTASAATVSYLIVQILQVVGVLRFPLDELLIYGTSLCIVVPFVLEILALHHTSAGDKRFWTHAAVIFTTLYAVFGVWCGLDGSSTNLTVQFVTPSGCAGRWGSGLGIVQIVEDGRVLANPHGYFCAFRQ